MLTGMPARGADLLLHSRRDPSALAIPPTLYPLAMHIAVTAVAVAAAALVSAVAAAANAVAAARAATAVDPASPLPVDAADTLATAFPSTVIATSAAAADAVPWLVLTMSFLLLLL